ncbi:serine/threonine-protein kinase [Arenimonas alkanexedens]
MKTSLEIQVLQLFEQALEQPLGLREEWLAAQDVPPEAAARALRLLRAEAAAGDFMEETALMPDALPPEFPKVGERLGNYELLKPLEAGGMGVVYLGRRADDVYDQQVAIKLVRPVHLLAAAEFRRQLISRFEDERSILARMSHPNVARILDGGSTAGGIPYLVMEYVDGVSLTDYCKANALDVDARLALFCKVCDGVQEAHRHLIVHRDLKPDNILVGENGEPRLLDFGIAKILEQEPIGKRDGTSLSAMTPAYASPEQVRQERLTTSSDVYSLGVVLYQLLAGVRPYELGGLRPAEAEHVVCDTQPDPMQKMIGKAAISDQERKLRRSQITSDVERIVAKAMHKESARRYGSAQELADDIRRYLAGQPVQAHPDSAGYRMRKFVGRHRLGVAASILAMLAIFSATGVAFWQADRATHALMDARDVNNFLMDVLKSSDPSNVGSDISVSEAVDLAAAKVAPRFGDRPEISSEIRAALGYSMLTRNKLDLAERELGLALEESTTAFGEDSLSVLKIREMIAQLRKSQDRVPEAEVMVGEILASLESQGLTSDPLYSVTLSNMGELMLGKNDYAEAERYLRRALAAMGDPADHAPTDHAVIIGSLAYAAEGQGEPKRAEALYRESIAELEALGPSAGMQLSTILSNLALLLDERDASDEAYALRLRSVELLALGFPQGHPKLVFSLLELSKWAAARGELETSLDAARRGDAMATDLGEPGDLVMIFARLVLADALAQSGDAEAADIALSEAQVWVDALPPEMKNLRNMAAELRAQLCGESRSSPLPGCDGAG